MALCVREGVRAWFSPAIRKAPVVYPWQPVKWAKGVWDAAAVCFCTVGSLFSIKSESWVNLAGDPRLTAHAWISELFGEFKSTAAVCCCE